MSNKRRQFLHRLGGLSTLAALGSAAPSALAQGPGAGQGQGKGMGPGKGMGRAGHAFVMPGTAKNKCATCVFWGGQRHISRDKAEVHVKSLGMCNNPASANYHRITSPDTGPMAAWVKWPALDA